MAIQSDQICAICQHVFTTLAEDNESARQALTIDHQPNLTALQESALGGCSLCSLLHCKYSQLESETYSIWRQLDQDASHALGFAIGWKQFHASGSVDAGISSLGYLFYKKDEMRIYANFDIHLNVVVVDGEIPVFCGRPISASPTMAVGQQWLEDCSSSHEDCPYLEDQEMPTRLIDVGLTEGGQEPKLIITEQEFGVAPLGQYVALSHCWGERKPEVLITKANIAQFLSGIPFASLERNFQDAITVTRALGFRYLWIDGLCILQDNEEDWQKECSRMEDVFANSALTIAAGNAPNSQAGFLHPRRGSDLFCQFDILQNGAFWARIHVSEGNERERYGQGKTPFLDRRAWVLQERLLSPRILYFGEHQMYYHCQTGEYYEALRYPFENGSYRKWISGPRHLIQDAGLNVSPDDFYEVVHEYCQRNLTIGDDKLPALSGIARRYQACSGDEYLAGLWRSNLICGLRWNTRALFPTERLMGEQTGPNSKQAATIKAPSWSWASCDYPVRISTRGSRKDTELQIFARIIDTQVLSLGYDLLGQVKSGLLTIEGHVRMGTVRMMYEDNRHYSLFDGPGSSNELAGWFDDDIHAPDHESEFPKQVLCLLLCVETPPPRVKQPTWGGRQFGFFGAPTWTGLGLVPAGEDTHRRVGFLYGDLGDQPGEKNRLQWIMSGERRRLRIV